MQDNSKLLYQKVGKIISEIRQEKGIKYTDFCYENDIPTSTYDYIISAKSQATLYNVAKLIKALGLSFEEFGKKLDKELPDDFMEIE